jgi:hypothetical protein
VRHHWSCVQSVSLVHRSSVELVWFSLLRVLQEFVGLPERCSHRFGTAAVVCDRVTALDTVSLI